MLREQAERIAQYDSAKAAGVRVVALETGQEHNAEAYTPMEPECWNLLRDYYRLVSVWHEGRRVKR